MLLFSSNLAVKNFQTRSFANDNWHKDLSHSRSNPFWLIFPLFRTLKQGFSIIVNALQAHNQNASKI